MKKLKIRIEDVDTKNKFLAKYPDFLVNLLKRKYDVEILTTGVEEPDLLLFSGWGSMNNVKWTKCLRIYFTAERDYPDFNVCDYAIGLTNAGVSDRFLHFPFYTFYNDLMPKYEQLSLSRDFPGLLNRKFCSVVVTDSYRNPIFFEFFNKLNKYKAIDSGGRWNNNVGGPVADKLEFIRNYKFNIAFENTKVDGYVTEKLLEPLVAGTLPIYWGSETVKEEFGEGAYVDISDFKSVDEAVDYIVKLDKDDDLYLEMISKKARLPLSYNEWCDKVLDFLFNAIESDKRYFDPRCNRIFEERKIFHHIHTSLPGKLYRKSKRLSYKTIDFFNRLKK